MKRLALSFDCGFPRSFRLDVVLCILKEYDIKATFFFTGQCAERVPDDVKKVFDQGHEIGNHTFSHPSLVLKTGATAELITEEITKAEEIIGKLIPERCKFFRPPFQNFDEHLIDMVHDLGYKLSFGRQTEDWKNKGVRSILEKTRKIAMPNSTVLYHMSYYVHCALPAVIEMMSQAKYTLCSVGELPCMNDELKYKAYLNWWRKAHPGLDN
jgi:peptidoglycan/xylan/chitin deacetylase (PgdA/CDA1 family)